MGFPLLRHSQNYPAFCACHGKLKTVGYVCPRCESWSCELPSQCKVCDLALVGSFNLARSWRWLFPVRTNLFLSFLELMELILRQQTLKRYQFQKVDRLNYLYYSQLVKLVLFLFLRSLPWLLLRPTSQLKRPSRRFQRVEDIVAESVRRIFVWIVIILFILHWVCVLVVFDSALAVHYVHLEFISLHFRLELGHPRADCWSESVLLLRTGQRDREISEFATILEIRIPLFPFYQQWHLNHRKTSS